MKRILLVTEGFPPDHSGAGLRAHKYSLRMSKKFGLSFHIVSSGKKIADKKYDNNSSIRLTKLKKITSKLLIPLFFVYRVIKFMSIILSYKPDIIHIYSFFWMGKAAALANLLTLQKPMVMETTLYGDDDPYSLLYKTIDRKIISVFTKHLIKAFSCIIAQSERVKQSCLRIGLSEDRIWVRPNPIDGDEFNVVASKKDLRHSLGLKNITTLINIGRISQRKDQLFLIRVLSKLSFPCQLLFVGPDDLNGAYKQKIISTAKSLNLDSQVHFLGQRPDVCQLLQASDLLVFSSKQEGFPNAVQEAMMVGVPVVIRELDGISKYINPIVGFSILDGKNELSRYVDAVETIIANKMSPQKIRIHALKHFSAKKIDLQYCDVYNDLVKW